MSKMDRGNRIPRIRIGSPPLSSLTNGSWCYEESGNSR